MPDSDVIIALVGGGSGLQAAIDAACPLVADPAPQTLALERPPEPDAAVHVVVVAAARATLPTDIEMARANHAHAALLCAYAPHESAAAERGLTYGADDVLCITDPPAFIAARLRQACNRRRLSVLLQRRDEWAKEQTVRIGETLRAQEEEVVLRLSLANEMRDNETAEHIVRMARYCVIIAEQLGFPKETCEFLYLAAQMHDIGKIGVPDHILCKAGKLSPDERVIMERHTLVAEKILKGSNSPLIQLAEIIATTHHERWDGMGYPRRLKGTEIPVAGRIAAVADVFDALASPRRYKASWGLEAARAELLAGSGTHFDPTCVQALIARWADVVEIAQSVPSSTAAQALIDQGEVTSAQPRRSATG
jgi:putative two-component system response regulator